MKTLFTNATIITQNETREIIPRGYIRVERDLIVGVGSGDAVEDAERGEEIIDASGYVVAPGLVNAHVHLGESVYMSFMEGVDDLQVYIERTNKISSVSRAIEEERRSVCDYSVAQIIRSGTTTIAGGRTNESSEAFGIRNVSGYMLMQSPKLEKFSRDIDEQFDAFFKRADPLLTRSALFIHSLATVSEDILSRARILKLKNPSLVVMVHVTETEQAESVAKERFGASSVQTLHRYGLLDRWTLLIHGTHLSSEDRFLISASGASLAHCLSSNLRVADGTADIRALTQAGIPVCIATDGSATAGTFSVLSEARKCYSYHNRSQENEYALTSQTIFDMITINPARALGMDHEIGSIEPGKKADLVFLQGPSLLVDQPVSQLLFADSWGVEGVMVGGRWLLWRDTLLVGNEKEINDDFFRVVRKVEVDLSTIRSHG